MGRVIFHVDVNSAFLSWEAVYRLYHLGGKVDLRTQAAAVGGDMAMRHGIILAKSIPAGTSAPVAADPLPGDGFASGRTGSIVGEIIEVRMRL